MEVLVLAGVALLSFANGANDNFKGVATLWGAGLTSYQRALAWATGFTALGAMVSTWAAMGLVAKFNGSKYVATQILAQPEFLAAVALGAGSTVLLAARLGLPISTTHAVTGALVGAGLAAVGAANVKFTAMGSGLALPLLFSPVISLLLTLAVYPLVERLAGERDCLCVDGAVGIAMAPDALTARVAGTPAAVRVASAAECHSGKEVARLRTSDALHWLSSAAISFARGLNDTPKIVALLLVGGAAATTLNFALVALAMAAGGAVGAARVAQTMSKKITPMTTQDAVGANLVAASLITAASFFALPVSTTHVTSGAIFGIGLRRRGEAHWGRVCQILFSWVGTLPLGAALAAFSYWLLAR